MKKRRKILFSTFGESAFIQAYEDVLYLCQSEKITSRYFDRITKALDKAALFPESNPFEPNLKRFGIERRYFISGSHKIIYTFNSVSLFVIDVWHIKQDPNSKIRKYKTYNL